MKNMMKPLISVIVPVYNGAPWLERCLDSLVFQTLKKLEIIIVDNGSTDDTWQILQQYEESHPCNDIIIKKIDHTNGPGGGRNVGLALAHGDYIAFSDVDDFFEYNAMELFYNKMQEADYDIVYCASYDVKNGSLKKSRTLQSTDKKFIQRYGSMVYWNKLFKKQLFQMAGKIPEDIVFEDIAYVSTLISLANNIGYIDTPLYYYMLRDDSGVNDLRSDRILHELKADDIAIKNCRPGTRDELIASVLYRVYYDLTKARWTYADKFIEYLKERRFMFDIEMIQNDPKLRNILDKIDSFTEEPFAQIIYYNAFEPVEETYLENINNAFWGDVVAVGLSNQNCDVRKNSLVSKWYDTGDFDSLAKYFALEKIYETGGFYISENVQMINCFNVFRYYESIWSFEDKWNFSDDVFGGRKGSITVGQILDLFMDAKEISVKEAIKNVMVMQKKINLNGITQVENGETLILDPTLLVTDLSGEYHISKLVYKRMGDEFEVIKKSTLECIFRK